jgi:hypothetical protein
MTVAFFMSLRQAWNDDRATLQAKFSEIRPLLNERQLRLVALAEAKSLGHGGIKSVAGACGLSRRSIERAKVEANQESKDSAGMTNQRVRRLGDGRKMLVDHQPGLLEAVLETGSKKNRHRRRLGLGLRPQRNSQGDRIRG